jgi:hypothetical protein
VTEHRLGRRVPTDWKHVQKYSLRPKTAVAKVEKTLVLPWYHWMHDQGDEGACVGFGLSMMMAILNEAQARSRAQTPFTHLYNARWLYQEAQKVDEWAETPPEEGTSVRAGCDVLRTLGHVRRVRKFDRPATITEGIKENRWARTVDEIRTTIAAGVPVAIGVNWYERFYPEHLEKRSGDWFIRTDDFGYILGGHCVCLYGASDRRQAFKLKNSWGRDYPLVWMPYTVMDRLLREDGEVTLVTDQD